MLGPKKHLEYYSRVYRNAWKETDRFRQGRGNDIPSWPEWCYLPMAGAFSIVSTEAQNQGVEMISPRGYSLVNDVGIISALAAWRITQGIYRFDRRSMLKSDAGHPAVMHTGKSRSRSQVREHKTETKI